MLVHERTSGCSCPLFAPYEMARVGRPMNTAIGLLFPAWGGEDSNLRPTDYESAALTN